MPRRLPRLLVTGFNAFPGAPVNPTERLVAELAARAADFEPLAEFRTEVIDVDYRALPERLAVIGKAFRPDIAIHFGLASEAHGFRLERLAWNRASLLHPDNSGHIPSEARFCDGVDSVESALPLAEIDARLEAAGLPVEYSDSAGEYLCNYLFYWSRAGLAKGFKPRMTGFIHVPPLGQRKSAKGDSLTLPELVEGATIVIVACCEAWAKKKPGIAAGLVSGKSV